MDRCNIAEMCIKLMDENFFFLDKVREEWDNRKSKMLLDVSLAQNDEQALEIIDNCLISLQDPHTRLLYKEIPQLIIPYGFMFERKKLYLECENNLYEIASINGVNVKSILDRYISRYKSFPLVLVENELIKDIQFMKGDFSGDNLQVCYNDGNEQEKRLYPIEMKEWLVTLKQNMNNVQMDSVYVRRVDQECICIQIVTFRDKDVVTKMMNQLEQIKGSYKTIIFDIRNNTGGYIDVAKELVSKLISTNLLLDYEIVKMDEGIMKYEPVEIVANPYKDFKEKQIIVFVNYRTMSSAEYIFSKALQIRDILIVGEETAGLKDQASVIQLDERVQLQITTKRYVREGHFLQQGITPDIFIKEDLANSNGIDAYFEWYKSEYSNEGELEN